ncbi:DNA replication/repair protein RecF [Candidatus Odyssella thessalonicensis]|uniref:DNA replication/repair protein RecF n=1 Tax=Candidatus Odyssella thessalonicensis TaxID=84647 RepID=UPI000225A96D|nr:DNA replication/repair protein RecF [Candidatus Odyssella thessalonicensis]
MQTLLVSPSVPVSKLQTLDLVNFRNYELRTFSFSAPVVALVGANGVGKTNILEAISLFSAGRGLRSAKLSEMKRINSEQPWIVSAGFCLGGIPVPFGTALDYGPSGAERRIIRINQNPVKNQTTLSEWLNIVWVIPAMARLFQETGAIRRKFVDRMVMVLNPSHMERINRYDHYLRERSQLLRQRIADEQWLSSIEQKLSEDGVAIAIARSQLIRQLTESQSTDPESPFPRFFAQMEGEIDQWCREGAAVVAEERIRDGLRQSRDQDALTGGAALGAHRSDLAMVHLGKHLPGELCSTGEQKMLLHALTLAFVRLLDCYRDRLTLLLLDDVVAHLDLEHRNYLFQEVQSILERGANLQIFMTGTNVEEFAGLHSGNEIIAI